MRIRQRLVGVGVVVAAAVTTVLRGPTAHAQVCNPAQVVLNPFTGKFDCAGAAGAAGGTGSTGAVGATGPAGVTGPTGTNGSNGTNGTNGATGAVGSTGTTGTTGATGPAGTAFLSQGFTGVTGVTITHNLGVAQVGFYCYDNSTPPLLLGSVGSAGAVTVGAGTDANTLTLTFDSSITGVCKVFKDGGPAGAAGSTGSAGSTGAAGTTGPTGPTTLTPNSQSAAYTLVLGDAGGHIYHPGADTTARTWTIPANSSVAYPVGTTVTFVNDTSAGVITIAITSDTLVLAGAGTTGSRTLAANGVATALKVTSTRWIINGTGLT